MLTLKEAALYFGIGQKKMRRIAEDNIGNYALYYGNRYLICRPAFEKYLEGLMKKEEEEETGEKAAETGKLKLQEEQATTSRRINLW